VGWLSVEGLWLLIVLGGQEMGGDGVRGCVSNTAAPYA